MDTGTEGNGLRSSHAQVRGFHRMLPARGAVRVRSDNDEETKGSTTRVSTSTTPAFKFQIPNFPAILIPSKVRERKTGKLSWALCHKASAACTRIK